MCIRDSLTLGIGHLSEDSADDEAFTCLDPFEHNWDEPALGLDDPA